MTNALLTKTQIIASRLFGLIEGYVYTARGHQDSSIYTGYSGIALIHFLIYKKTKDINSFKVSRGILPSNTLKTSHTPGPVFFNFVFYSEVPPQLETSVQLRTRPLQTAGSSLDFPFQSQSKALWSSPGPIDGAGWTARTCLKRCTNKT